MNREIEQQREHFNNIADTYREARSNRTHLELKRLLWTDFLGRNSRHFPSEIQMLEPMCGFADGNKIITDHLRPARLNYAGFDYSEAVVNSISEEQPDLHVWQQDVTTFEPGREEYDLAMILGGLHHVPTHVDQVLGAVHTALKPGGLFLCLEPTHGNSLFKWVRDRIYQRNQLFDEETEKAFPVKEHLQQLRESGFDSLDIIYPGLLAYVLYYNPDAFPGLNRGREGIVRSLFAIEKPFYSTKIAKFLSFATLSLWRKI